MDNEKIFRDVLDNIAKEHKYEEYSLKISPISSGGANYTSVLYTAVISAANKEDLHLFGKVANISEKLRKEFDISLFDAERLAYQELVKIYKKIEDRHGIPEPDRLVLPKVYGFNSNVCQETVVLENLSAKGYSVHDRLKSVDWKYASKAVEVLARFHSLSMVYAEENPESFQRYCERQSSLIESLGDGLNKSLETFLPISLAAVRDDNRERLKAFFDNKDKVDFRQMYKTVCKSVLLHGDFRPSNLMHRNNEDGSIDMIILDLQTIRASSTVIDLLYFIFTATDATFRKEYYTQLVDHYYNTLSRLLRAHALNPDKIYSREDFDFELQERLYFGLVIAVFAMPMITVESQDAPDMGGDASLDELTFKTGPLLSERMNGVVDDFVRWGVL